MSHSPEPAPGSDGRLRLILDSAIDYAVLAVDPAGRIVSWNAGAERLFGLSARDIVGRPLHILFTPEERRAGVPEGRLARASATGRSEEERWHLRSDGGRFLASSSLTAARDEAGGLVGFAFVARDVTAPRRLEDDLRAAKEAAEAAVRAKSTFLATMGHELRTPLNAIIGYSEMLADEAADRQLDDLVPDLGRIREAGHLLLRLINNVLDLSRIEAGGEQLDDESFDVANLVRGVVRATEARAEKQGNVIQVDYASDLGTVRADVSKVAQSLTHLLSNALKFTEGGTITVRARRERDEAGSAWIAVTVADDGIGMSRDELARLFEPFVQADGSPARRYGGTGLGLTIAHRYCRLMGGRIDVQSEPGRGSTFTMWIPASDAVDTTDDAASSDPDASR